MRKKQVPLVAGVALFAALACVLRVAFGAANDSRRGDAAPGFDCTRRFSPRLSRRPRSPPRFRAILPTI